MSLPRFARLARLCAFLWLGMALLISPSILLGQGSIGRDTDALDQARRLQQVATQKVESEIRTVLRDAERQMASDPAGAEEQLKGALSRLENDTVLSESRRETLKRLLKDRIRVAASTAQEAARQTAEQGAKQAKVAAFRMAADQSLTSQEAMLRLRQGIQKWQKEAGNPAAASAAERTNSMADRVMENRQLQTERERRTTDALRQIDRTALLPRSDFELPKDWKARTQNRKGSNDIPLTPKERAVLRTLDAPISVSFKNSRFEDVIDYLQTVTGLPIAVHRTALEAVGVSYDTPVTLQIKGVALRSVLRKILNELGLAYVVKDETLQVVTAEEARATLVVRVHYIGDLLFGGELARQIQAAQLIELITSTIEPQSWQGHGGSGKIFYDDLRRSLVIQQSAEVQPVLSGGLR
ncbi:MAG TPA: hypothetical protein VKU02_14140 [Gemmataceae bacterium]|nr:hypothetical protein [Gemmataceae bacterium]